MARTNFEKLRVYRLSEKLADQVWDVVLGWDNLARDTVGKQLIERLTALVQTSPRVQVAVGFWITNALFVWPGAHSMKLSTGCAAPSSDLSSTQSKLRD